jgi:hypothetical protein
MLLHKSFFQLSLIGIGGKYFPPDFLRCDFDLFFQKKKKKKIKNPFF